VLGALLAAASLGPATAQEPRPAPVAGEAMEVVLVNVEVWVHDERGIPIQGLGAESFELREDGVSVPITHFAEIRTPPPVDPLAGGLPVQGPPEPAPADASAPGIAPAEVEHGHLVVYFDQLHLAPLATRRLAAELREFLVEQKVPHERVLVVRQGFELFTEASFGSTRKEVEAALERLSKGRSLGEVDPQQALARLQSRWEMAQETRDPCRAFTIDARAEIASRITELERRSAATLENLRATARLLSALPGPKTLLLVSDSLETRPGADLVRFAQNTCPGQREWDELARGGDTAQLVQRVTSFAHEASRNRITVYPFRPSGLRGSLRMSADQRSLDVRSTSGVDLLQRAVQRDGLLEVARQTGGWAVLDRNRFEADLDRVGADMTGYYSLAYSPPNPGVADEHTLEVRLRGEVARNARVRHRLGYRDPGRQDLLQEALDGAIAFGVMRNPLGVRIGAGVVEAAGEGRYAVPLHVLVPAAAVAFLPGEPTDLGSVEVTVQTSDARTGKRTSYEEGFRPARPAGGAELLDLRMRLELPEGVHVVAVAVRDAIARELSVVSTTVAIHDPGSSNAADTGTPRGAR
jgi:VWFA-related protein